MAVMAKKKPTDRHTKHAFPLRLPTPLKEGLDKLAEQEFSTVTAEIIAAIRDRLRLKGILPAPHDERP